MNGHKVEGCQGSWINIGTLTDPFRQVCARCRVTRQKPVDDDETIDVASLDERTDGLTRLRDDLERDESLYPIHCDTEGFWFWTDVDKSERMGPYDTLDYAEAAYGNWLEDEIEATGRASPQWTFWFWIGVIIAAIVISSMIRSAGD